MPVHPTSIIHPAASVHCDAAIGPFCVIGAEVEIGARTQLMAHMYVEGPTTIGEDNVFYPYSSIGAASQDLKEMAERLRALVGQFRLESDAHAPAPRATKGLRMAA